jgi:hypothetical protein
MFGSLLLCTDGSDWARKGRGHALTVLLEFTQHGRTSRPFVCANVLEL